MSTVTNGDRWTLAYPNIGTGPVPVEPYISKDYFELEREKIFKHTWLNVGRVEEVPEAGDYFVKNIAIANASILVVRGKDGEVRAFHNVCRHRATKLVWDEKGCSTRFSCNYHGWTYSTDGSLIGVPEEDMFFDFDKSDYGLVPIATGIWEGFIFINLEREPKETLTEYLGELVGLLGGYPFGELPVCFGFEADLKCNWKVIVDSQQEGYHAKMLHRRSLPGFLTNKENPSRHALDIQLYKRHRMISYFGNLERKPTPVEALSHKFGASVTKREFSPESMPPGINPTRSSKWAFDEYVIFPNFHVLVFFGMCITHNVWPISHDRAIWEARLYLPQAENAAQCFSREYGRALLRDAWLEDGSTLEASQVGLESGAVDHFVLQDQELLLRHSFKVLEDYVHA
jgi:phenylpropionate dioxygenase-like ring-hydroxylating dioxygenase large terminal subunit